MLAFDLTKIQVKPSGLLELWLNKIETPFPGYCSATTFSLLDIKRAKLKLEWKFQFEFTPYVNDFYWRSEHRICNGRLSNSYLFQIWMTKFNSNRYTYSEQCN